MTFTLLFLFYFSCLFAQAWTQSNICICNSSSSTPQPASFSGMKHSLLLRGIVEDAVNCNYKDQPVNKSKINISSDSKSKKMFFFLKIKKMGFNMRSTALMVDWGSNPYWYLTPFVKILTHHFWLTWKAGFLTILFFSFLFLWDSIFYSFLFNSRQPYSRWLLLVINAPCLFYKLLWIPLYREKMLLWYLFTGEKKFTLNTKYDI